MFIPARDTCTMNVVSKTNQIIIISFLLTWREIVYERFNDIFASSYFCI